MIALIAVAFAGGFSDESSACGGGSRPVGPLSVTPRAGALGTSRSACLRSDLAIGGGGSLLVDTADFYGRIGGVAYLDGRVRLSNTVEVFGRFEGFRYDSVIAPIAVSTAGLGATSVGVAIQAERNTNGVIAFHGRATIPTQSGYVNAHPWGGELGLEGSQRFAKRTVFHGGINLYAQTMSGPGPSADRYALAGVFGINHSWKLLSLVLDVPISVAWNAPLDYIALQPGVRFGSQGDDKEPRGLGAELGLFVPVVGADRTLVALDFRLNYRFR